MAEISPLRRRMIEDMTVRNLSPATQQSSSFIWLRRGSFSSDECRLRVARRMFFTIRSDGDSGCTDFCLISTP